MDESWITTTQAAQETGYNIEQIRRLSRSGKINSKKWGREWMVDLVSLLTYIHEEGRGPQTHAKPSK
jgi:hypothetical protein